MAADSLAIREALANDAATGVQSVSVAGQSVTNMSVDDRIKAAEFVASQNAATKPHFGLRMVKLVPPGGG